MNPLAPSRPPRTRRWDQTTAAHLARRAGFGAGGEELAHLVELGLDGAVDRFVDFPTTDQEFEARIRQVGGDLTLADTMQRGAASAVQRIRRSWIYRLCYTPHPLQEKLALFWHDHFACQQGKLVRAPIIQRQVQLFRRLAAGSFRDLLREIARDPGMLVFLDNRVNEKANPNENWGRELLELFSLGRDNYTQKDVHELARVFTGWSTTNKNSTDFVFNAHQHDSDDKVLFGQPIRGRAGESGIEEGVDAIERILHHDACSTFLAQKLVRWFANHEPDPGVVKVLGAKLRSSNWSIRETLRELFRSTWFYERANQNAIYKHPVEFVVSAARRLGVQNAHLAGLEQRARLMGMDLFQPPSVAGWTHGRAWVNSGSTVHRFNFALDLSNLPHTTRRVEGTAAFDVDSIAGGSAAGESEDESSIVRAVARRLLDDGLRPEQEAAILACLKEAGARGKARGSAKSRHRHKIRAAIHLVLASPEFALC